MIKNTSAGHKPRFTLLIVIVLFSLLICAHGQDDQEATSNSGLQERNENSDLTIKINVEEVRLDVVVLDWKGRQITDLTEEDFEIFQDNQKQDVTSCRYISHERKEIEQPTSPDIPTQPLKRESVERTIIFLVNDFKMSFEGTYSVRMALRKFVNAQMLPGDLISIIRTSHGNATLQAFTSDKRELLSRIEAIQWSTFNEPPKNIPRVEDFRKEHNSQLLAINYCIRALRNMPGRKSLMLMTTNKAGPSYFYPAYDRIADAALRAGVVIHTLTGPGTDIIPREFLNTPHSSPSRDPMHQLSDRFDDIERTNRYGEYFSGIGADLPLSRKTGGVFLTNNWSINGIGDVREEMKGYYLISYIPPENTFSESSEGKYHPIKVKVKRRLAEVHARDGFFGSPAALEAPSDAPPPLVEAMFSPFRYNDLNVSLASGYVDNVSEGYLLPTWMHLDGRDLEVVKEEDGRYSVSFEAGASTTDIDGLFQDFGKMQVGFSVAQSDIQKLREDGINFTVSIPVKEPGGYYVRAAVRDTKSEAKGSAYQFIDIPDLKKNRLALSSLYIIGGEDDASWIRSMASNENPQSSGASRRITVRSPARKDFLPGESFEYMAVIYNAKTKKENPPDLESQIILFKDGAELLKTEVEAVDLNNISDFKRIPVRQKLTLNESMQPGDYILQFLVRDKNAKEKESLTAQTLSFRIVEKK